MHKCCIRKGSKSWEELDYLIASQGNCDGHIQGLVDNPCDRFDQRHEEQREPDNADEQDNDHASHAILHSLLLLLAPGLRVSLQHKDLGGLSRCLREGEGGGLRQE